MDPRDRNDFFDELLEAGLARYAAEEPRPGLERRILKKALAGRPSEQWRWAWALAAGTAALALAGLFIVLSRRPSSQVHSIPQASRIKTEEARAATLRQAQGPERSRGTEGRPYTTTPRLRRTTVELGRPEEFPTPVPLTEQEKLLIVYVRTGPASEFAPQEWRPKPEQELEIPKLTITALAPIKPLSESQEAMKN